MTNPQLPLWVARLHVLSSGSPFAEVSMKSGSGTDFVFFIQENSEKNQEILSDGQMINASVWPMNWHTLPMHIFLMVAQLH